MIDTELYKGWRRYRDDKGKVVGYVRYGHYIRKISPNIWTVWHGIPEKDGTVSEGSRKLGTRFPSFKKARKYVKKVAHRD